MKGHSVKGDARKHPKAAQYEGSGSMKVGPSDDYERLLTGRITPEEYVRRLKRTVDARHGTSYHWHRWSGLPTWERAMIFLVLALNPFFPFEHYLWLKVAPFKYLTVNVLGLS